LKTPAISICYGVSPGFYKAKFATDFDLLARSNCRGSPGARVAFNREAGADELIKTAVDVAPQTMANLSGVHQPQAAGVHR
jgi:hypothetical protein